MKAREKRMRSRRRPVGSDRGPTVRIAARLVRAYRRAQQLLRRELGAEAPALSDLIAHEFSARTVAMIVEEHLECPVTPRLRRNDIRILWGRRQVSD